MQSNPANSSGRTLAVLHPAFALTGILQAIGGPLLPSMATTFHLNDSQSGLLFLFYFSGTSLGAFFCRADYARAITLGLLAMSVTCLALTFASRSMLLPGFLLLGISVGVPMSGISLFIGRAFPAKCAPLLTILNFTWSAGALFAPLLAAQILKHHDYRAAYILLAFLSAITSIACAFLLRDAAEVPRPTSAKHSSGHLRLILIFALAAFLQVGIENTAAAWLSTFSLRMTGSGVVLAAASTSLYWIGFLGSRGASSFLLLRAESMRVFRVAVLVALAAALVLAGSPSVALRSVAMFVLGMALAPVYPLVIAGFFARARHTSDSRWVLATAGFGGSVLPWLAGSISNHTGSLRMGMFTIPAALLLMVVVQPALRGAPAAVASEI